MGARWTEWGRTRRWGALSLFLIVGSLAWASPASSLRTEARSAMPLHVIPFPGTPDVTPVSNVIFSSLRAGDLRAVEVRGSTSGLHSGRLVTLPHGDGVAFDPARPFRPGELVRVTAALRSPVDGTLSGDPGSTAFQFSFRIGSAPARVRTDRSESVSGRRSATRSRRARTAGPGARFQSFHSEPGLRPPVVKFTGHLNPHMGDVFVTAQNPEQPGPMIVDTRGRLVWFHPVTRGVPMNLQVQRYQGQPVLTWWVGQFRNWGQDMIFSTSYKSIAVIHGGNGLNADLHDFRITSQGTALIDAYQEAKADLTSVGGPRHGHVLDCIIQELDIKTGRVLWEWHALGHVPVDASHAVMLGASTPYDFFHLNSIQQLPDGNLIISARNTWSVYEIDRKTGKIIWTLGGKRSSFRMGTRTNFEWQHNAWLRGNRLSLFDDGSAPQEEAQSSAKVLRINQHTRKVSLVRRYTHSPSLVANSAGSTQVLPNGNIFVGWGPEPDFSEYTPGGHQIFNGVFVWGTATYRAFRFPWKAHPVIRPKIALQSTSDGGVTIFASWNGATRVRKWQVLDGLLPQRLTADGLPFKRTGFETAIHLNHRPAFIAVQAMAASGQELGQSGTASEPLLGG